MARRSQCSNAGDNPLDPNYLPPHYREEYRLAIDSLVEEDVDGYYEFLQRADVVDFLSPPEITYIQSSIQLPRQGGHPQHPYLETGGDGSSDTYWPIHSDLDAPGLDLGWPQMHHFGGPAEVTTLVNPPEPDMPSIKEQARRLIKNSQQVIAIVMDMFTDVDIFADLLNAAMRNVAVYILLDEQNVHLFINMVSNCRVNLQAIQFLRVRTVCGITYHCRSGKTFKGQMMDRFILTDCRAVLSGNYSFMWSFEKLHRCMAHLFLGQLVSTFDEEFRILFAQSQPLILENLPGQMEDYGSLQKRPYPGKRTSLHREPKKFMALDTAHPEDWPRHSYDERMDPDRAMVHLKRHDSLHGPADFHGRFSPQQQRKDPHFDQGPSRLAMLENPAFKRHSYAEGGRYTFLQQQGLPDHEAQGRQLHRGQMPNALPGPEADYGGYEKFWNQDYHPSEQFTEPALPPDLELPDNFDPVLNYLSSTRNVDFDQGPEKLQPPQDLAFGSPYARRLSAGQVYACQTSPTPSSSAEEKHLLPDPNADRKDPKVKRGLRNWRISSYLNTYDDPGDEGLPSMTPQPPDPFEAPSHPVPPVQQAAPGMDLVVPKIPNVREFKVPAVPRVSQIPGYVKTTTRERLKKQPEENPTAPAEVKTTPTPSESSSTTEGDKTEEAEPKEPKTGGIRREESFRRNYNAAVQRSSRLRSSLIFNSLEESNQDAKTATGQEEDDSDQKEGKAAKLPFVSHVLGKRRTAREPFEWSRYIKSSTADKAATEASKPDDGTGKAEDKDASKENDSKDLTETPEVKKSSETTDVSPPVPSSKPSESEISKTTQPIQPPKSLLTSSLCVDMSDPDTRLMFFKELAAKRKAAKAAEAEKSKEKAPMKTPTDKKEEHAPKETSDKKIHSAKKPTTSPEGAPVKNITTEDGGKTGDTKESVPISDKKKKKQKSLDNNEPCVPKSCENNQTSVLAASEIELRKSTSETPPLVSADTEAAPSPPPENPKLPGPAVKECILTATTKESSATVAPAVAGADKNKALDSTSKESSLMPNTQTSEKAHLKTSMSTPALPSDSKKAHASSPQSTSTPTVSSSVQEDVGSNPVGPPEPIRPSSPISLQIIEEDFIDSPDAPNTGESAQSDSASHLISSQSTPVIDTESGVFNNECDGASGVDTSEAPSSDLQKDAPGSESSHVVQSSPKDIDRDVARPSLSSFTPESCLPALDTKAEQKTTPPPVDTPPESTTDFPVHSTTSGKMPESEACESSTSETPAPADNTKPQMEISKDPNLPESGGIKTDPESTDNISQSATQESICNDKTNGQVGQNNCSDPTEVTADETGPQSPQSKQQKSNQLRYHSSTANVLSSSNLRDDTKLLLEQISANSQSRNEAPKEAPVTDDEKEDEADKNAQREKERGIRSLHRGQPKDSEEREKLLERIQSMRKERKVYSRFEMAP